MNYQFGYDKETLSFQPVTVRSRLTLGGEALQLGPQTGAVVVGGSGYEGKVVVGDSELMPGGKAHRFRVGLKRTFTLQEYRKLILGKQAVPIQVTLYPNMALPVPTAGVPIVADAPPVADTVQITMPDAALARLEAEPEGPYDPETGNVFVKARVHLPDVIANRAELERRFTHQCRFAPQTDRLDVVGTSPDGEWARAHLRLQPGENGDLRQPETVPVLVTADIDGVRFEAEVRISVSPARELVLELSASRVRTTVNRPALLKIRAMDKLDGGTLLPADDAEIIVTEPKGLADVVTAVPSSGRGALVTEIRQVGISDVASGDLLVEASVPTGTAEAHVEVWPATGPYVLTWERLDAPRPAPAQTAPPWRMTWDGEEGAWRCEPLLLKLMWGVDGGIEPQPIGSVEISDSRGWLELETAPEQAGEGSIVRVQGKAGRVRPEISEFDSPSSIRAVHPLPGYQPPDTPVYTVATFSASSEDGGEIVASLEVPCLVEPPQIQWHARQDEILRLSGEHHQIELTINSGSLPPHWQSGMEIMVAFNDPEAAERRGVALGHARVRSSMVDDSGSFEGTAGATVDLSELPGDSDGDLSDDALGWVSGTIQVTSSQLCFRKVDRVTEVPDPESLDLSVVVRSPYLGVTDRETIPVNVQPQLAALYLGAYPYKDYPWEDLKSLIQVIRDDQGAATSWSKLPLTLKHLATDGWPAPPVRWSFVDEEKDEGASEALDDHLTPPAGTASEYVAPHRARWEELGNPEERAIQCHIGPGEETVYVDEARDQDLYLSGAIQATLILAEALPKIKVAVGVKPSGLPDSVDGLALRDERIYDALNRSFVLEVDLQRLPLDRRET